MLKPFPLEAGRVSGAKKDAYSQGSTPIASATLGAGFTYTNCLRAKVWQNIAVNFLSPFVFKNR
jgi:hypothetical protein